MAQTTVRKKKRSAYSKAVLERQRRAEATGRGRTGVTRVVTKAMGKMGKGLRGKPRAGSQGTTKRGTQSTPARRRRSY